MIISLASPPRRWSRRDLVSAPVARGITRRCLFETRVPEAVQTRKPDLNCHRSAPARTHSALPGSLLAMLLFSGVACELPGTSRTIPVHHPQLSRDYRTRVNLRVEDGVYLRSDNRLSARHSIPVGTKARIVRYTAREVDIDMQKVTYTMRPEGGTFDDSAEGVVSFIDKYFAPAGDSPIDGASDVSPLRIQVEAGQVVKGMTKEEVYAAIGPPHGIGESGSPALGLSRRRILDTDRWTYTRDWLDLVPRSEVYIFREGKLAEVR
jgi:hypothetical protein